MKDDIKLPPLPYPQIPGNDYDPRDMRDYARSAIAPYKKRITELEADLEAIGAGGVSARRITSTPANASAKITERSQAYLDSNLDVDEHASFISWAREAHDYPDYARLILDSEWCQGAVAGWQGAIEADRQQRGISETMLPDGVYEPSDDEIREVFLANGFTIKPGHDDLKQYVYDAARALLTRYGQSGEPEGWQLVPKEPTYEMIQALWETITVNHDTTDGGYKAMLEAAPEPPCTL